MKKTLLIAALTLLSASAFASKARVNSLQQAHTVAYDVQDIFNNPAKATELGTLFTVEFGQNTMPGASTSTYPYSSGATDFGQAAEGGFLRAEDNRVWGLYLGRKSYENYLLKVITNASTTPYLDQSNPIELLYGQKNAGHAWAGSLSYSQGKDNSTAGNENSAYGVRGGWLTDTWNAYGLLGLASTAKGNNEDYKGDFSGKLGGEYDWRDMRFYGDYLQASGTNASGTAAGDIKGKLESSEVGVEHKVKSDVAHFFYGVKWTGTNITVESTRHNNYWSIPLYAGIEADAASWLVIRAALSQSLFNYQEGATLSPTLGYPRVDKTNYYDTLATLGAGLKFNKLAIDGMLSAGNTGNLNFNDGNGTNSFMSEVSATYYF